MSNNKSKVSCCFVVPIETAANAKEVKAAYQELRKQIVQFANAITRDPNVVVTHSVVSADPKDLKPAVDQPVDSKIAELQSIAKAKPIETAKTPAKEKEIPMPEWDEEEKPHIVTYDIVPVVANKPKPVPAKLETPKTDTTEIDSEAVLEKIFKDLKKTEKSLTIIKFFISKNGEEVVIGDIVQGTGLDKIQVSSWLAITGKQIKGLESVKRGTYKFTAK